MTTKEVKLWERYKKEVEDHNQPIEKKHREIVAKHWSEESKRRSKHDKLYQKAVSEWESKGTIYKMFHTRPRCQQYFMSVAGIEMGILLEKLKMKEKLLPEPTYENFLDWRAKNKL